MHVKVGELDDTLDEAEVAHPPRPRLRTPISVPRADTPDDDVLARAVEAIREGDPCWNFAHQVKAAIDAHADRVAQLEHVAAEHAADRARLDAIDKRTSPPRWRRWVTLIGKALGAGAITAALALAARALIAHGTSTAESRAEHERVMSHDRAIRAIRRDLATRDQWLAFLAGKVGIDLRLDDNTPQDDP